ncbi:MAG: tRNA-dihydrouridine synthase [Candidatus Omnitrophica bacterium]|nr:tRNA-dihydrouridine synthase [Candidatus Omnitrophota bacterium]
MTFKKKLNSKFPLILAPMAGISSLPFRIISREFGAQYAFLEMIHARSLSYESKKTRELLRTNEMDHPLGVQLLSKEEDFVKSALKRLNEYKYKYDLLDFNAACPVRKISSRGEGAGLLQSPGKLKKLLKIIVKESPVPVSVKIRLGWDNTDSAGDIAMCAQDAGIDAIFVHGRTKVQGYRGEVDYKAIGCIKKRLKIPVIASGNILNAKRAKQMFDETGCDGLLVARGALGNPWIFKEIYAYLVKGILLKRPAIGEIADAMQRHFDLSIECFGDKMGVIRFRKFYVWYTKGVTGIRPLREEVMRTTTKEAMNRVIEKFRFTKILR